MSCPGLSAAVEVETQVDSVYQNVLAWRQAVEIEGIPQVAYAKLHPDLFLAASERLGVPPGDCFVVGDSIWDLLAAQRAGGLSIVLLSGGYGSDELVRAGAYRVYEDPADLLPPSWRAGHPSRRLSPHCKRSLATGTIRRLS